METTKKTGSSLTCCMTVPAGTDAGSRQMRTVRPRLRADASAWSSVIPTNTGSAGPAVAEEVTVAGLWRDPDEPTTALDGHGGDEHHQQGPRGQSPHGAIVTRRSGTHLTRP